MNKDEDGNRVFYEWEVKRLIKQAQEDAIMETVKECGCVGLINDDMFLCIADKLIKEL